MIKKRSGAPPPRRRGAAVRASPAPRRPHSNSLRSRAAAASPDPSARPKGRDAQPRPLRCSRRASRARRSVLLPPGPRALSSVRCSSPAGPISRPVPRRGRRRPLPGGMVCGPSFWRQEVRHASPMSAPRCGRGCGCGGRAAGPREAGR